jgi:hypothetical protein
MHSQAQGFVLNKLETASSVVLQTWVTNKWNSKITNMISCTRKQHNAKTHLHYHNKPIYQYVTQS